MADTGNESKQFYDREFAGSEYATVASHGSGLPELRAFIDAYALRDKKVVEIGCGRGAYQDLVVDYTGIDLSDSVRPFLRKPFIQGSASAIPLPDSVFDAAWTIYVLEHVPEPEAALLEMRRILKPGGLLFLYPAWQCRSWAADGYPVRPYTDFPLAGKLVKASIPIRDSVAYRSLYIMPRRVARTISWAATRRPTRFRFRTLVPNYEKFWMPDSDAVNSMDPYEAILWFRSRGDDVLDPGGAVRQFLVRTGQLVIRINK
jgi:ubiquinone/menaquinone biosynthesis C-methylase UbiE